MTTIVQKTSRNNIIFLVCERKGFKKGAPVNGKTIGHIIDEKCVLLSERKEIFSKEKYKKRKSLFETVVFVSNMSLKMESVYQYYKLRWKMEMAFSSYKGVLS